MNISTGVPADDSNLGAARTEPQKISGEVSPKIATSKSKTTGEKPRARGKEEPQVSQYVAKVYKKRPKLQI